ncbi:MAG: outer membrane protein OmpA-like peptidoglycan-associated protein [Bacteroidia bacterium]|jgi:outer membrane protein OmpA-like peptidoglycan-associated protein
MPGSKKVQKLWEQVLNERKPSVRRELYKQILDSDDDHHGAVFAKAYEQLSKAEKDPMSRGISFGYKPMKQVADLCPEYHMYPYYYMGLISMQNKEFKEAEGYFKKFLTIEFDDPRWYPKDYEEKYLQVEGWIPQCLYYDSLYSNPVPFEPTVVKGVSSRSNEYLGIISPDNEVALYIRRHFVKRKNDLTAKEIEEFTRSKRTADGHFDEGKAMPLPFNITENIGSASLTVDNKRMFLTICNDNADGYKNCDVFYSDWHYHGWDEPINVGSGVNGKNSFEGQPTITPDGKTLYFVSIREDEIGAIDNMDIYVSHLKEDGSWGSATNLGTTINTKGNEKSPFIHEDSHTLYFSSDGHEGIGNFDIYYTKQNESREWVKPKNIGFPINTEGADVGFFVAVDGKTAFISSEDREDGVGGWDLFSFPLYKEARPEKVLFLKGKLKDENNKRITEAVIEFKNMDTKEVTQVDIDSLTGAYVAVINFSSDMIMTVKKKDAAFTSRYLSIKDSTLNDIKKVDIEVKQVEVGEAYELHDIRYGSDRFNLSRESNNMMGEFAIYLKANPRMKVAIHGHTDNVGSPVDNMKLSQDRAKAVEDILVKEGISTSRLSHKGFGETKPTKSNSSAEGRAANRRTEFVIVSK